MVMLVLILCTKLHPPCEPCRLRDVEVKLHLERIGFKERCITKDHQGGNSTRGREDHIPKPKITREYSHEKEKPPRQRWAETSWGSPLGPSQGRARGPSWLRWKWSSTIFRYNKWNDLRKGSKMVKIKHDHGICICDFKSIIRYNMFLKLVEMICIQVKTWLVGPQHR